MGAETNVLNREVSFIQRFCCIVFWHLILCTIMLSHLYIGSTCTNAMVPMYIHT